jgi:uncharacterized membrane protein/protein-disulfide isomerase
MSDSHGSSGRGVAPRFGLRLLLCLVACAGVAISLLLTTMQVGGPGSSLTAQLCRPTETVNCSDVLASPWGKLGGAVPTSFIGAAYFFVLGVWYAFVGLPNRGGRKWHLIPLVTTLCGFAFSLLLIYVMALQLATWCQWCLGAHAINVVLLIGALVGWPRVGPASRSAATARAAGGAAGGAAADGSHDAAAATNPSDDSTITDALGTPVPAITARGVAESPYPGGARVAAVTSSLVALGIMFGLAAYAQFLTIAVDNWRRAYYSEVNNADYIIWKHGGQRHHDIPIRDDESADDAVDAPHTLVVFTDFQCPRCYELEGLLHGVLERFAGRARVVYRHYPLCATCNDRVRAEHGGACLHAHACEAAMAAEAVRLAGGAEKANVYHRMLFRNQRELARRPFEALAVRAGVSREAFLAAMDHAAVAARIDEDVALAKSLRVEGTPAVFLDGRRLNPYMIVDPLAPRSADAERTWELWRRLLSD